MEMPDEVREFFRKTGAEGGKARKNNTSEAELKAQGKDAAGTRWRNYHAGEYALHGTAIPEAYKSAIAAMSEADRAKALLAAKKRASK